MLVGALRDVPLIAPNLTSIIAILNRGRFVFLFKTGSVLSVLVNSVVLAMVAPVASVGYFAGAERLIRALMGLSTPVSQAVFPRVAASGLDRGARLARLSFVSMVAMGAILCATLLIAAPLIVRVFLGSAFGPSVVVLRILSVALIFRAAADTLGVQWMLPRNLERPYAVITVGAGVFNVLVGFCAARFFLQIGMATVAVSTECLTALFILVILWRRNLSPWNCEQATGPAAAPATE
jgi:PST family polysaccharide transporter